jgi:Ger(x)C family germination protein
LLISEDVARDGVREIFDFFARDPEMRRRAKIFVTKGKADDFFQQKPKSGEISSLAIAKLEANANKTPTFGATSEFGYVSESLHAKRGFFAPMLYLEKGRIKAAGTAVFNREGRMVGVTSEYEIIGSRILRRSLKQGLVVVPNPDKPGSIVVFELYEAKITVKPDFSGDTVRFIVAGEFTGNVGESVPMQGQAFSDECLNKIAQAVAAEYTNHVYAALKYSQTVKADALDLGDMIYRKNPQYWNKIKDRWEEEILPTVTADVNIKVRIRGSGLLL